MSVVTSPITAEALLGMSDQSPCELVAGEIREMVPAGARHGKLTSRLDSRLSRFVERHDLGTVFGAETGVVIRRNPDTVRAPDAMFVSSDRLPPDQIPDGFLTLAPDLAVEVVSPRDAWTDVHAKVDEYLTAGVDLVWIVDGRNRKIHVYEQPDRVRVLNDVDTLDGGDVLPGFSCPVTEILD